MHSKEVRCLQALEERFAFPECMGRSYKDIVDNLMSYTMEDLAGSVFWMMPIVELGPPGFQNLFKLLQPALWHYAYNREATKEEMGTAAQALRKYAEALEASVKKGLVRAHHAQPVITCSPTCASLEHV
jgi:hypothetical protein